MLNVELPNGPKPPFPAIPSLVYLNGVCPNSTFNTQHSTLKSKMRPKVIFWSHFADFGPILFLKGEMLKSPNEENEGFCPTADPPLSHC